MLKNFRKDRLSNIIIIEDIYIDLINVTKIVFNGFNGNTYSFVTYYQGIEPVIHQMVYQLNYLKFKQAVHDQFLGEIHAKDD